MIASILLYGILLLSVSGGGRLEANAQAIDEPIIVPLDTTHGTEYYTQLNLGYPEQQFKAQAVLGQRYSWVFSKENALERENKYDSDASVTFTKDEAKFNEKEPNRWLTGQWASDKARIGELNVESLRFGQITDLEGLVPNRYDAVIGIANYGDLIDQTNREHSLRSNMFSLHLNKASPTGALIFGGVDKRFYEGTIQFVPAHGPDSVFEMNKIHVDGPMSWRPGVNKVRTTTTTDKILVPPSQMSTLNDMIKTTRQFDANTFGFEQCDTQLFAQAKNVKILVGESEIILTPNDYIIKTERDGETVCESAFVVGNEDYEKYIWELGTIFLRKYFTVYDFRYHRFGFAKSRDIKL